MHYFEWHHAQFSAYLPTPPAHLDASYTEAVNTIADIIPAQPLHNSDIVSVHFNNFPCIMMINSTLTKHLSILSYIYIYMDEY